MQESEALSRMIAPGTKRPGKMGGFGGVIQIHLTRACDKSCFGCTQGSNLGGKLYFMSLDQFDKACQSLRGYFGVVGVFGGNPALHPQFEEICRIMRTHFVKEQCGLWCNNIITAGKARAARATFDPSVSNLNVHLDAEAHALFREHWPEARPFGLDKDSRHSPVHLAMKDVLHKKCLLCSGSGKVWAGDPIVSGAEEVCGTCDGIGNVYNESKAWELISGCDINQHWSAMIGVFRGELRAWFCEVAGAQSILHQDDPDYPDTGMKLIDDPHCEIAWWEFPIHAFANQVRKHCHECAVPLRGYGQLAQADDTHTEQTSKTHEGIFKPKRRGRAVELVTVLDQIQQGKITKVNHYLQNAEK